MRLKKKKELYTNIMLQLVNLIFTGYGLGILKLFYVNVSYRYRLWVMRLGFLAIKERSYKLRKGKARMNSCYWTVIGNISWNSWILL